jgi:hypothetical protein
MVVLAHNTAQVIEIVMGLMVIITKVLMKPDNLKRESIGEMQRTKGKRGEVVTQMEIGLDPGPDIVTALIVAGAHSTRKGTKEISDTNMQRMLKRYMSVSIEEGIGIVREEMIVVLAEMTEAMMIGTVAVTTTMEAMVVVTTENGEIVAAGKNGQVVQRLNFPHL